MTHPSGGVSQLLLSPSDLIPAFSADIDNVKGTSFHINKILIITIPEFEMKVRG